MPPYCRTVCTWVWWGVVGEERNTQFQDVHLTQTLVCVHTPHTILTTLCTCTRTPFTHKHHTQHTPHMPHTPHTRHTHATHTSHTSHTHRQTLTGHAYAQDHVKVHESRSDTRMLFAFFFVVCASSAHAVRDLRCPPSLGLRRCWGFQPASWAPLPTRWTCLNLGLGFRV